MAHTFQIVIDCADPHTLADWWAETLGWKVEAQDEAFIRRMIAEGHATDADATTHNGALVWGEGAAIIHPDGKAAGPGARLLFQQVPETKTVKNRVHLDLDVGPDHVEETLQQLTARGATFLYRERQGPMGWVTITDPEGNELCLH